jgi:hypothetical protein
MVKNYLWAWCRKEASMPPWREEGEEADADADAQDALGQEEEEEVEAIMGGCHIYQV